VLTVDSFFYKSIQIYSQKVESVDSFFQHFFHNNDTRSTMSEPAKDTAIEITPKPQASSVRVPRIVAEINRVASRVRDRNKREEEDNDDAEVLENDTPTPSQKPADIKIIRENTHYRGRKRLNILVAFLLVLISVLLLAVCVFLARIDENIRSGGATNIQSLASPPPPSPYSPPPPTVITPSSIASIEHKAVVWADYNSSPPDGLSNFKTAVENEGVSTTDMEVCTTVTTGMWYTLSGPVKKCLMELLMSTLAKDNWALIMAHSHPSGQYSYDNAYYFTRTNYTTPTVAVSPLPPPPPSPPPPSSWDGTCQGPSCPIITCGTSVTTECKNGGYCDPDSPTKCLCSPDYGGDDCSNKSS